MALFKKLFGSPGVDANDKQASVAAAARMFKEAQAEFLKVLVQGLADTDAGERGATARLIVSDVIPALELDENLKSRAATLRTLSLLVTELRPPESEEEMQDLDNALFHYTRRQILKK